MTFRVLVIATNVEREPFPVYPIGAAIIARALEDAGADVTGLDFSFLDDPPAMAKTALDGARLDLVGISVRAVDTTSSLDPRSYLEPVVELVKAIRIASDAPVVVGGPGYSLFPELLLTHLAADFGVVGEGEETVAELVASLKAGEQPSGIPGLLVRRGSEVVSGGIRPPSPVEAWKTPATHIFPVEPHLAAGGMASVQTKRGCPLNCTYCTYPTLEGRGMRLREPTAVAAEVRALSEAGVDYVFFVDNNFNVPKQHAAEICRCLATLDLRPEWTAFLTPCGFEEELAELMAAAGARSVEFGSESAAAPVLEGLGKHHGAAEIRLCDRACHAANVTPAHYFIFGGPGETADTVEQSLELIVDLHGPVVAMLGIRVYPRTQLHQRAIAEGIVSPLDPLLEPTFYFSPKVDPEAVMDRLRAYSAEKRNFVVIGSELGLNPELIARLRQHGRKGPLWEFMRQ